jgi:diguanylate cyclase (GGDEF)-like protein
MTPPQRAGDPGSGTAGVAGVPQPRSADAAVAGGLTAARDRILVVDDDVDIAAFVKIELEVAGFEVNLAHDGLAALELVSSWRPDLVVLDLMMPGLDGVDVTRRLRAAAITSVLPIIMLTAKGTTADKVLGLTAGADDYIVKPFDTLELVARVRSTLRRKQEFREVSPLTGLPGNTRILREIGDRLRLLEPFAVCYCDIDGFKAVNDAYGFARGDEFIVTLARMLQQAVMDAEPPAFLGHVGGDDFVVICAPAQIRPLTERAVAQFEAAADELYDEEDRARGYVSVKSRRDGIRDVGLVTVSIGVALSSQRRYADPREVVAVASEMKTVAKTQPGSFVAVDRRREL